MKKHADDKDGAADSIKFLLIAAVVFVVIVLLNTHGLPPPHGLLAPP